MVLKVSKVSFYFFFLQLDLLILFKDLFSLLFNHFITFYWHFRLLFFLFIRIDITCLLILNRFKFALNHHISLLIFENYLTLDFWKRFISFSIISFFNGSGFPHIFIWVLKKGFDWDFVFLLDFLINSWLIFLSDTCNDLLNSHSMLFHLLVMASTLASIPSDDHVRHHLVDSGVFLKLRILE